MCGTMRFQTPWLIAMGITLLSAGIIQAQTSPASDTATLVVKGEVKQELRLSAADLKVLPRTRVTAKGHDSISREYEGVTLQTLLVKAGAPMGHELRGKNMTMVAVLAASDDYHAVFSLAELDADFAGAQVLVADAADGKPLDAQHGPVQAVVPGDKRERRWVRMLTTIRVLKAGGS